MLREISAVRYVSVRVAVKLDRSPSRVDREVWTFGYLSKEMHPGFGDSESIRMEP